MSRRSAGPAGPARSAPIFAALGDATRLELVDRLCADGPSSIAQLTLGTQVTRQAVTKHLEVLAEVGLVRDTRSGRQRIWELAPDGLDAARLYLDQVAEQWDEALERLRQFVEE